jgi:hypothetical protein
VTTSVARVAFRGADGGVSSGDLARVDVARLVAGRPWRVFRWRSGQAHYSGWFWSATMRAHVVYESRLELSCLLLADFDPEVRAIAAQPFQLSAEVGGRERRHVPDFLFVGADGLVRVVNVKPAARLADRKVADVLEWAGGVFGARGWRHEVWSGAPPVRLANVRFLAGYRHPDRVDAEAVAVVDRAVVGAVVLGELGNNVWLPAADVRAAALHLLWLGTFRTDLSVPLSAVAVLERAA